MPSIPQGNSADDSIFKLRIGDRDLGSLTAADDSIFKLPIGGRDTRLPIAADDSIFHLHVGRQDQPDSENVARNYPSSINGQSSSGSTFSEEYESTKNTAKAIGGGIIAVIVVVVVLVIGSMIAACCIYSKRKDRKRQHDPEMKKYMGENRASTASANTSTNDTAQGYGQGTYPTYGYEYNNETGYGYSQGYDQAITNPTSAIHSTNRAATPPAYAPARDDTPTQEKNTQSVGTSHAL
ncbi:hypothetical protein CTRI78_v008300 [Colletotrichum trifolii]|uniref:Uncharacterized protein n=1 Tax=Colletotrichum trifolii TaxID=5466 RepID=A0A4R8QWT4_COLTR|nr:hypothetical protein CTRI78_v008300 [Colletotrichum trifolii]